MPNGAPNRNFLGVLLLVVTAGVVVAFCYFCGRDDKAVTTIWFAGAGALGLLSGFTTGASKETGIGGEFLKFVSGGILVPLMGGVVTLLQFRQGAKESYTYVEGRVETKTTAIELPAAFEHLHPLWVLGAFFIAYGLGAILGILLGIALREWGKVVINVVR